MRTPGHGDHMLEVVTAILVVACAAAAFVAGVMVALATRRRTDRRGAAPTSPPATADDADIREDRHLVTRILAALPDAAILVDSGTGKVIEASDQALALGLASGDRVAIGELTQMIFGVRRTGESMEREFTTRRSPVAGGKLELRVRVAPMSQDRSLVLVEDLSAARRVDEVRRDFVANVSHELKTPVGALSLLAEAVVAASDDPESVRHFAGRMQAESTRLVHLVNDLIDLSRLQGDDPLRQATVVAVDDVVADAVDATRLLAQSQEIEIVYGGTSDLAVFGVENQLVTALRNLVANAIAYSPPRTRVAVATRLREAVVEVCVTDQGIGIPQAELGRVFERFYRVDQARSRVTGGTGLGLSIVKHVCHNHGGSVDVWSIEGAGSTFTLRLPFAQTAAQDGGEQAECVTLPRPSKQEMPS